MTAVLSELQRVEGSNGNEWFTAPGRFSRVGIVGTASGRVDPKSYPRWDNAVGALTSIDPADAAQLYVNVKPLFDQA